MTEPVCSHDPARFGAFALSLSFRWQGIREALISDVETIRTVHLRAISDLSEVVVEAVQILSRMDSSSAGPPKSCTGF